MGYYRFGYRNGNGLAGKSWKDVSMSKVRVHSAALSKPGAIQKARELFDHIRQRAFELFERRDHASGHELDDWLAAEREIIFVPRAEIAEQDATIEIRIELPGVHR
jgi:hypothetical protein